MLNFTIMSQKFIYTIPCILTLISCKEEEEITPIVKTPPTYSQYADSVISFSSQYSITEIAIKMKRDLLILK
ncbi:MAG: hypothetical protein ACJAZ3_000940 [Sphingobacteriales bacterium]|jgi:hypothetical protein